MALVPSTLYQILQPCVDNLVCFLCSGKIVEDLLQNEPFGHYFLRSSCDCVVHPYCLQELINCDSKIECLQCREELNKNNFNIEERLNKMIVDYVFLGHALDGDIFCKVCEKFVVEYKRDPCSIEEDICEHPPTNRVQLSDEEAMKYAKLPETVSAEEIAELITKLEANISTCDRNVIEINCEKISINDQIDKVAEELRGVHEKKLAKFASEFEKVKNEYQNKITKEKNSHNAVLKSLENVRDKSMKYVDSASKPYALDAETYSTAVDFLKTFSTSNHLAVIDKKYYLGLANIVNSVDIYPFHISATLDECYLHSDVEIIDAGRLFESSVVSLKYFRHPIFGALGVSGWEVHYEQNYAFARKGEEFKYFSSMGSFPRSSSRWNVFSKDSCFSLIREIFSHYLAIKFWAVDKRRLNISVLDLEDDSEGKEFSFDISSLPKGIIQVFTFDEHGKVDPLILLRPFLDYSTDHLIFATLDVSGGKRQISVRKKGKIIVKCDENSMIVRFFNNKVYYFVRAFAGGRQFLKSFVFDRIGRELTYIGGSLHKVPNVLDIVDYFVDVEGKIYLLTD